MAYSKQQLERLWIQAGGPPQVAEQMARIALRESGGRAHINNAGLNKNGSVDYGLWQINSVHGYDPNKLYNPLYNAKAAVAVYKKQGPRAWATYNPSIDDKYIGKTPSAATPAKASKPAKPDFASLLPLLLGGVGGGGGGDPLESLALTLAAQRGSAAAATPSTPASSTPAATHGGVTHFDGKPVASWIAPILKQARSTGLWKGSVTSGVRTKSEQLAAAKRYGLQHYPNGPLASNHVEGHPGAVDVSDPEGLKRALRKLGITKLKSSMPEDPVHFSQTGH